VEMLLPAAWLCPLCSVLWKGWLTGDLLQPIHPMLSGCDVLLQLVLVS